MSLAVNLVAIGAGFGIGWLANAKLVRCPNQNKRREAPKAPVAPQGAVVRKRPPLARM